MKETLTATACILVIMAANTFLFAKDPSVDDAARSGVPAMIGWLIGRMFGGPKA
jgi:hypothetical protein